MDFVSIEGLAVAAITCLVMREVYLVAVQNAIYGRDESVLKTIRFKQL
ncbi:MAG: hypothetical protein OXQ30_01605 [Boseongicola sp.]|nr:hypothetical protein [Boseongicola sp.]